MWYIIDGDSLEEVDKLSTKRKAVLRYSKSGKSNKIMKGIYLVSDETEQYVYESYIVHSSVLSYFINKFQQ